MNTYTLPDVDKSKCYYDSFDKELIPFSSLKRKGSYHSRPEMIIYYSDNNIIYFSGNGKCRSLFKSDLKSDAYKNVSVYYIDQQDLK